MKRVLTAVLCLVLSLSLAGCGSGKGFDPANVRMEVVDGSVNPSKLIVHVINNTKTDIAGGIDDDYTVEKRVNGEWSPVEEVGTRSGKTETYIFQGERELTVNWAGLCGTLTAGDYRITKVFYPLEKGGSSPSGGSFSLSAEFRIE